MTGDVSVIVRMAVVVKRKIQLYYWKKLKDELLPQFLPLSEEINVNDIPKSMVWCQESICVGFRNEYALLDVKLYKRKQLHFLNYFFL